MLLQLWLVERSLWLLSRSTCSPVLLISCMLEPRTDGWVHCRLSSIRKAPWVKPQLLFESPFPLGVAVTISSSLFFWLQFGVQVRNAVESQWFCVWLLPFFMGVVFLPGSGCGWKFCLPQSVGTRIKDDICRNKTLEVLHWFMILVLLIHLQLIYLMLPCAKNYAQCWELNWIRHTTAVL